ncbi:hypothetical protein J6590_012753 [Homalodisca vitripennis]|nr:hypothetical protein J6590_012753 [Homalodisca vitripennis]
MDKDPKDNIRHEENLQFGVYEAIATFNKGNIVRLEVLEKLGMFPGNQCIVVMKSLDELRVKKAEKAMHEMEKSAVFSGGTLKCVLSQTSGKVITINKETGARQAAVSSDSAAPSALETSNPRFKVFPILVSVYPTFQSPYKASQSHVDFPAIFNAISAVIPALNPPPPTTARS